MIKILLYVLLLSALATGCDYPCMDNPINPAFINFSPADIDTIALRAYKPNDNYQHLVDTTIVINLYASIFTISNDTTIVYVNSSDPHHWISPGFDWQVYVPTKNRLFSISNIISENKNGNKRCLNPITSFIQDGQPVIPKPVNSGKFYTSGYIAYLRN